MPQQYVSVGSVTYMPSKWSPYWGRYLHFNAKKQPPDGWPVFWESQQTWRGIKWRYTKEWSHLWVWGTDQERIFAKFQELRQGITGSDSFEGEELTPR